MTEENTPRVGYGNPPRHTQFKKGTSGNPRGRPRKREDQNTVLQRVLNRKIRINGDDHKIPIRDALIRRLKELALQGDKQALAPQRRILTDAGYDEPDPGSHVERQKRIAEMAGKFREKFREQEDGDDG